MDSRLPDLEVQIFAVNTAHFTESFDAPDKVAIMALVENTEASSGSVSIVPQHSNDGGRTWIDKNTFTLTPSGTAAANSLTPMFGVDDGSVPNMGQMRFKVSVTVVKPNIRIFVAGRSY